MDLNLQECELYSTFDFGIQTGSLIAGKIIDLSLLILWVQLINIFHWTADSDYVWCVNGKDGSLAIKNVQSKDKPSLPYHNFGIGSNVILIFLRQVSMYRLYYKLCLKKIKNKGQV
jgi:hypothetical protein